MNKINKLSIIIIHILVWCVLFTLPYLLSPENHTLRFDWVMRGSLILCAIVFYANYLFLVEKYLLKKKFIIYFSINVFLLIALILFKQIILVELFMQPQIRIRHDHIQPPRNAFIYLDTISLIIPLIFSIVMKMGERWLKSEAEKKDAENFKLQSELQNLKYQLQPHFFFNSLNSIYSLVDISPEKAKETIHSLGKLMRYLLYESNTEKVELNKEIEFLEKYVKLMKLRSSDNVTVKSNFPTISSHIKVAPLLFISLIENAFKHGVSATEPSEIEIELKEENGIVNFYCQNQNYSKSNEDRSESGIGLENLRKRLTLIYLDKYIYKVNESGKHYTVRLIIDTKYFF